MNKLVVAISSSALFDLADSDRVYREEGVEAYSSYQIAREDTPLAPGDAFHLAQKLLNINGLLGMEERVEVVLLSRNSADTGLRVFKSIEHHRLAIHRAAFTGGSPPYKYMRPFGCQLFLSTNQQDVIDALHEGVPAASIVGPTKANPPIDQPGESELRFAFDGDAVLFSDEAERVYQEQGLDGFIQAERAAANDPLPGGPFKPFLAALHSLQGEFGNDHCPIRTALVTARSAPAHERVIKTLRAWNIKLNESLFLGGNTKAEFLDAYSADVFFDDQAEHCRLASDVVATGHVPHGVINESAVESVRGQGASTQASTGQAGADDSRQQGSQQSEADDSRQQDSQQLGAVDSRQQDSQQAGSYDSRQQDSQQSEAKDHQDLDSRQTKRYL